MLLRPGASVANVHAEGSRVDVAVAPDEESTEDGLSAEVENTVENGFRVGGDNVATFAETPRNWVETPEEEGPATTEEEALANVGVDAVSVLTTFDDEDVAWGNCVSGGLRWK